MPFVFTWPQWARRRRQSLARPIALVPGPDQLAHRTPDTTPPGQLQQFFVDDQNLTIFDDGVIICIEGPIINGRQRAFRHQAEFAA